eukprot:1159873-Pelagomonas_calceolata.AAC.13
MRLTQGMQGRLDACTECFAIPAHDDGVRTYTGQCRQIHPHDYLFCASARGCANACGCLTCCCPLS